jgi:AbiV family abortive infection protein
MSINEKIEELNKIRDVCISHAQDLLNASKKVFDKLKLPNISYHLAVLALEEIGKFEIISSVKISEGFNHNSAQNRIEKWNDDHIKKIFWAFWGEIFGHEVITKDQIESLFGLAKSIHGKRLKGLYFDPTKEIPSSPRDEITNDETMNLINIVTAKIEMTRLRQFELPTIEKQENIRWFLSSSDDLYKKDLIFSGKSMEKLVEFESVSKWISWLKNQFEQAEKASRSLLLNELKRKRPQGDDAFNEKWKLKIRFYTNTHSIRSKSLNYWNNISDWIKLRDAGNKKNELIAEFIIPNSIQIISLWNYGLYISRRFILALNIGSMGFFGWNISNQISQYYEEIRDIKEKAKIKIDRIPKNGGNIEVRAISELDLKNTAICFGMIPHDFDVENSNPFFHYLRGITLLSKSDIHLPLEKDTLSSFHNSLKSAMLFYGDWDGKTPYEETFIRKLKELIQDSEEANRFYDIFQIFENNVVFNRQLTLDDVMKGKLLCDFYLLRTFYNKMGEFKTNDEAKLGYS